MNFLVGKAPHLPLFVTKGISISVPEALLLYIVLLALFAFAFNKKYRTLVLALTCFIVFLGIRIWKDYIHSHQQIFIVYDIPKCSAITFISGKQCITTKVDSLNFCYHIQEQWWERGVRDSLSIGDTSAVLLNNHLSIQHNFLQFNNTSIAFVRGNDDLPTEKVKVHYLIVSGTYRQNIAALQNAFIFDKLIFDSSVSPYRIKKWKEECEELHIKYYDVSKQGAFIINT